MLGDPLERLSRSGGRPAFKGESLKLLKYMSCVPHTQQRLAGDAAHTHALPTEGALLDP